jgi:hypothetical protein
VLSCSQHVYSELHSAFAQSTNAHSLREVLSSIAHSGSIATDQLERHIEIGNTLIITLSIYYIVLLR